MHSVFHATCKRIRALFTSEMGLCAFALVFLFFLYAGLYSVREHIEPDYCDMSYCWPHYIAIPVDSRFSAKYKLFLYREYSIYSLTVTEITGKYLSQFEKRNQHPLPFFVLFFSPHFFSFFTSLLMI